MSQTLFVIGAGASQEVGLPVGSELIGKISSAINIRFEDGYHMTSGDLAICDALRALVRLPDNRKGDINPYLHTAWQMCEALTLSKSIDNYMDAHQSDKQIQTIGKLGIVRTILQAEKSSKLATSGGQRPNLGNVSNTWYGKFFKLLSEDVAKERADQLFQNISFIIFNYDRCVEHFLYNALQSYYSFSHDVAAQILNSVTFIHPYGVVGALPWQIEGEKVDFGGDANRIGLEKLATQVKTFTERIEDADTLTKIQVAVNRAKAVVFLGFAFHKQNVELILQSSEPFADRIFGTAHGISDHGTQMIRQNLRMFIEKRILQQEQPNIYVRNDLKCEALLGEFGLALTAEN